MIFFEILVIGRFGYDLACDSPDCQNEFTQGHKVQDQVEIAIFNKLFPNFSGR